MEYSNVTLGGPIFSWRILVLWYPSLDIQHESFHFRSDASVREHLSEACIKRRDKQAKIGIQTSIIAWIVELVGSMTVVLIHSFSEELIKSPWMVFTVMSIYFVLIPGSYLLATEIIREHIFDQGWRKSFKIPPLTARVAPVPNVVIELVDINGQ